ncbi:hypothetical protein OHB24_23760 [Kribbella sp. NBC_00482]|uniref:hypothetical protein n=1 Tax=Kribbella sp. NBC_00482 TaxID=2975968 RepID=UPI002E18BB56
MCGLRQAVDGGGPPYRYVTVEGPVAEIRSPDATKEWEEAGGPESDLLYVLKPQQWNTADFTSDFA